MEVNELIEHSNTSVTVVAPEREVGRAREKSCAVFLTGSARMAEDQKRKHKPIGLFL